MDMIKNNRMGKQEILDLKEGLKTSPITITLSRSILNDLQKEMERLDIKNRSFMVEMIMMTYFKMPITEGEDLKKNN